MANARVAFYAPPVGYFKGEAVEVNTKTNGKGEFSLVVPPLPRAIVNGIHLVAIDRPGHRGEPVAGRPSVKWCFSAAPANRESRGPRRSAYRRARVAIRTFLHVRRHPRPVPESLAESLATSTGPDGTTTIGYLAARDQLARSGSRPTNRSARFRAGGRSRTRLGAARDHHQAQESTHPLRPPRRRKARPVAGQLVEVWSRGKNWLAQTRRFQTRPGAHSRGRLFQTPANSARFGLPRRIRPHGQRPDYSDWITIKESLIPRPFGAAACARPWGRLRPAGKAGCGALCFSRVTDPNAPKPPPRERPFFAGRVPAGTRLFPRPRRRISVPRPDDQASRRECNRPLNREMSRRHKR